MDPQGSPLISSPSITIGPSCSRGGSVILKYQSGEGPPGAASVQQFCGAGSSPCRGIMDISGMKWNMGNFSHIILRKTFAHKLYQCLPKSRNSRKGYFFCWRSIIGRPQSPYNIVQHNT